MGALDPTATDEAPPPSALSWADSLLTGVASVVVAALLVGLLANVLEPAIMGGTLADLGQLRQIVLPLVAAGALAGLVWGLAEGLAARGRARSGLALLAVGGALAPLGGDFGEALLSRGSSLGAMSDVLALVTKGNERLALDAAVGLATALALAGPLLMARAWGASRRGQSVALALGGVTWLAGLAIWPLSAQGGRPFELLERTLALAQGSSSGLDIVQRAELLAALGAFEVVTLPLLLEKLGGLARRLLEQVGVEDHRGERAAFDWFKVSRRATLGLGALLLLEVLLIPGVQGGRWAKATWDEYRLRQRAAAGDSSALTELGVKLVLEGDRAGLELVRRAARAGDVTAMNDLAWILAQGPNWTPADPGEAFEWAQRAQELGNATGTSWVDWIIQHHPELPAVQAHVHAEIAAIESRIASAGAPPQFNLDSLRQVAELHEKLGELAEADFTRRRAAATGNAHAMLALAQHLLRRDRPSYDPHEAALWLERTADLADPDANEAATTRGEIEEQGLLGPPDDVVALKWYRRAVEIQPRNTRAMNKAAAILLRRPDLR